MDEKILQKLEGFFATKPLRKIRKGEIILKPGIISEKVGFIKSGYIRLYSTNESGQEITLQYFKPILYLTTIFALTGKENKFFLEAITHVEMYEVPNKEMLEYLKENPDVYQNLIENVMTAFLELITNSAYLLSGNAYTRVALMVNSLTAKKGGIINGVYQPRNDFGITHKLIASLTGLTRETVTLQMIKLEKEGIIINKSKSVQVLDKQKLLNAAKME